MSISVLPGLGTVNVFNRFPIIVFSKKTKTLTSAFKKQDTKCLIAISSASINSVGADGGGIIGMGSANGGSKNPNKSIKLNFHNYCGDIPTRRNIWSTYFTKVVWRFCKRKQFNINS